MASIQDIPVSRLRFKEDHAPIVPVDLIDSIQLLGILNPLLVIQCDDCVRVYIGNQRLAAAQKLGMGSVPCRFVNSQEEVEAALAEYRDP